jgi:hypothetical protein
MSLVVTQVIAEFVQHIAALQIPSIDQWQHSFIHCEHIPN